MRSFLSLLVLLSTCSVALSVTWRTEPSMPQARSDFVTLVDKSIFYINGGCLSNQTTVSGEDCASITNTFHSYNTLSQTWSTLSPAPHNRTQYTAASVQIGEDTLLYYFGGIDDDSQYLYDVDVYSVLNGRWTSYTDMLPESLWRSNAPAFVINSVIYVPGGYDAGWNSLNTVLMLNTSGVPLAQQRFTLSSVTKRVASGDSGAVIINGKAYVFGGFSSEVGFCTPLSSTEEFDPATNTWSLKAELLTSRGDAAYAATGGLLFVMGGERKVDNCNPADPISVPTDDVEYFNPATNKWQFLSDIPVSRFRFSGNAGGPNDQTIYNIGGQQGQAINSTNPGAPSYYPVLNIVESMDVSEIIAGENGASALKLSLMSVICAVAAALLL